ncbi:MAG TPA: CrcB family protein [Actinobacteria bacterium]|jgi:fluoride ion exporter CrcB/FEX|nr:CrcB family protein [Actinomycetota bacterium]
MYLQVSGFLFIGLPGAFTAFSTLSLETVTLIKEKEYINALISI